MEKRFTEWRVFYISGSKMKKTKPMSPDACLKHFRKCYGIMWMDVGKICGSKK